MLNSKNANIKKQRIYQELIYTKLQRRAIRQFGKCQTKRKNSNLRKKRTYTKIQRRVIQQFGISQIKQTASTRQPLFCHRWDGADNKDWGNGEQETPFNNVLQKAYCALASMDLAEVEDYPAELEQLRQYVFVKCTKVTREQFKRMLLTYKSVLEHRAEYWRQKYQEPSNLEAQETSVKIRSCNKGLWGSRRQWAFGEAVSRLLFHFGVTEPGNDLHPVFAILLYPLGGIAGYGNMALVTGDMHTAVSVHAIVHDAFGYVDYAHNVGPSYNYLAVNSVVANDNCMSCQSAGIVQARRVLEHMGLLGDKGRSKREREMVACRKALSSLDRESAYPEGSLPTVEEIKADYASRRDISLFNSCGQCLKQLMLNVHMKMWKDPAVYAV